VCFRMPVISPHRLRLAVVPAAKARRAQCPC
jgi:hypothetical protein